MKRILQFVLISLFLGAAATGCGSSNDDIYNVPNLQNLNRGGIRVVITPQELAQMFPPTVAQATVDPNIVEFQVYAFDSAGNVAAQATVPNTFGNGLDVLLTGLQLLQFDVVVAGIDGAGNVVAAYEAANITPVPSGLRVIGDEVFAPLDDFELPDEDENPDGDGELNIDVTVTEVNGQYQVSWNGGAAHSVSAIPVDLAEELAANPPTSPNSPLIERLNTEALTISTLSGDGLNSPVILVGDQPSGVTTNGATFEGFTGDEYRISVTRTNGDTGYVDTVLTARQ